ncbi:YciI family protein [Desulfobacterota bacterium M19]
MFVISLNYIGSLEQVDSLLEEHIEFLTEQYNRKIFIASGRKIPRTGGVILAAGNNKNEINSVIKQDPFYINKVAEYDIVEFSPSMTLPEFETLIEQ